MKNISFIIFALGLGACASNESDSPFVTYPPTVMQGADIATSAITNWGPQASVTLEMALTAARDNSPALKAVQFRLSAQQHIQSAAGRFPNPEVTLGNEKIGLSQTVVLGGDLDSEKGIADARLSVVEAEYEQVKLQVDSKVSGAFASLLMLQLANDYQRQRLSLTGQSLAIVNAQVKAGEIANSATATLQLEHATLQSQAGALMLQLELARQQLATLVGAISIDFVAEGSLNTIVEIPKLRELLANIDQLPSVAQSVSQVQVAKMQQDLAYAQAIPDFNIELFYTDDEQIEAAVLFELPLNTQRRSAYRSAQQQLLAAKSHADLSEQQTRLALQNLYAQLKQATAEYSRTSATVVTTLQQRLNVEKLRFDAGDIGQISLNNAENMLLSAQIDSLGAWLRMMLAWQQVRSIVLS